jgi:hypothetical protein
MPLDRTGGAFAMNVRELEDHRAMGMMRLRHDEMKIVIFL